MEEHIKSGADITVVANRDYENMNDVTNELVMKVSKNRAVDIAVNALVTEGDYTGMGMYIMSREMLVETIENSVTHGLCHFEKDFIQRKFVGGNLSINVYKFDDVVLRNRSVTSYYQNNLKLSDEKIQKGIFKEEFPIYTKVRDEVPAYYASGSRVDDSIVADGCVIKGTVINSVLFRNVVVEEGAVIENCVIMQGTTIGKDARLINIIADKDVTVNDDVVLAGAKAAPFILGKCQKV